MLPELWIPSTGQTLLAHTAFGSDWQNSFTTGPFSADDIALGLRCKTPQGCAPAGDWLEARAIALSVEDDASPTVLAKRPPPEQWVSGGVVPLEFGAIDNVGIRSLRILVDGKDFAQTNVPCYDAARNTQVKPCAGANQSVTASVPVSSLPDGVRLVSAAAHDVGDRQTVLETRLRIDREAPSSPRRVSVAGGEGWRSENRFALSWVNPPETNAPIVGAEYEFCPSTNGPYDTTGCVKASGSEDRSDTVRVPGDGAWSLRVALRDAAGNSDRSNAAIVEPLRLDTQAPSGSFSAFDPEDPLRILLSAADSLSGVGSVEIEMRRDGESAWRALTVEGTDGHYSAVANDAEHPDGTYVVRARVTDRAGNERTITTLQNGSPLRIALPLRSSSTISAGKPTRKRVKSTRGKRPRYQQVLLQRPTAAFGASVQLSGNLRDLAGNPRVDAAIDVLERVDLAGREWLQVATVRTRAKGEFTYRAKPGPSRTVRFVYRGSALTRPEISDVELRVRAAATIRPDRKRAYNGGVVIFTGRLVSGPVPESGKVLALQALTTRGWRTFATPRARAQDGRWRFEYRFTGTSVRARYRFRVVVLAEGGYPYAQGQSKTTTVLVDP